MKLTKNQGNAKQKPEAGLLLFDNYPHSSSTLLYKNNRKYSKISKRTSVSAFMRLYD